VNDLAISAATGPGSPGSGSIRLAAGAFSYDLEARVDPKWTEFSAACQRALADLVEGRPEAFKALWSRREDVVIMGAFGGYERGWQTVGARLDWASAGIGATDRTVENIVTTVGDQLAFTVDLEHMTRQVEGHAQPRTLRCTQAYRLEDGEWRVILRHADELARTDQHQGRRSAHVESDTG
jgi:hypothetical protein